MKQLRVIIAAIFLSVPLLANADLITVHLGTTTILGDDYEVTLIQDDGGSLFNSFNAIMPSITFTTLTDAIAAMEAIQALVGDPMTFDWTPADDVRLCCTRMVYDFGATNYQYITNADMTSPFSGPFDLSRDGANGFSFAQFSAVSVPEPGTLALLGLGLAGMGLTRRKKIF